MKLFACIWSLIVLALTVVPCIDKPEGNVWQKTEISQSDNDSHQDDIGHCSPFCTCQCCQTSVQIPAVIVSAPSIERAVHYSDSPVTFENPELFEFLVPPRA